MRRKKRSLRQKSHLLKGVRVGFGDSFCRTV